MASAGVAMRDTFMENRDIYRKEMLPGEKKTFLDPIWLELKYNHYSGAANKRKNNTMNPGDPRTRFVKKMLGTEIPKKWGTTTGFNSSTNQFERDFTELLSKKLEVWRRASSCGEDEFVDSSQPPLPDGSSLLNSMDSSQPSEYGHPVYATPTQQNCATSSELESVQPSWNADDPDAFDYPGSAVDQIVSADTVSDDGVELDTIEFTQEGTIKDIVETRHKLLIKSETRKERLMGSKGKPLQNRNVPILLSELPINAYTTGKGILQSILRLPEGHISNDQHWVRGEMSVLKVMHRASTGICIPTGDEVILTEELRTIKIKATDEQDEPHATRTITLSSFGKWKLESSFSKPRFTRDGIQFNETEQPIQGDQRGFPDEDGWMIIGEAVLRRRGCSCSAYPSYTMSSALLKEGLKKKSITIPWHMLMYWAFSKSADQIEFTVPSPNLPDGCAVWIEFRGSELHDPVWTGGDVIDHVNRKRCASLLLLCSFKVQKNS